MPRSERRPMMLARALAVAASLAFLAPPSHAANGRFTGRVVDAETQAPIAGAEVELSNAGGGQGFFRARTDRSGMFAVENVSSERVYMVVVGAAGYADFVLSDWQFRSPQRLLDVMIPLDRAGSLEVRVTGADGRAPVAAGRVSVRNERAAQWWEGGGENIAPVYGDKQGVSRFTGLKAGYYTVSVEASGLLNAEVRRVAVRRGEITPVPVKLSRPGSLSGTVRLYDGSGAPNLPVIARGPAEGAGTTGPDGSFSIGDLPPGRYRVEVSHEGFEPARLKDAVALREGEARAGIELTVVPRRAELAFVLEREVFAPATDMKLGLRSFRIGLVDLTLFQIPIAVVTDPRRDFRAFATPGGDTTGLVRGASWRHETADGPPYAWREEELPLPAELTPGVWVLRGRAGTIERRALFFVSDLGLLVKRSGARLLVSAASLKTGLPVANASIFLSALGRGPSMIGAGQGWREAIGETRARRPSTDADGLVALPLAERSARVRVVAVSDGHGVSVAESPLAPAVEQGGDQAFLYTDRPIYRPGQTVFWKLFARKATASGYAMPDPGSASITLLGPDGASLPVAPATLSPRGSADGAIVLPQDLSLGDWTLGASVGHASGSATLAVQEYRKPEYRVEVTPERAVYVNGDEVRFTMAASYFFGAAVLGAAVRYNLFESRLPSDESGEFAESGESESGYGRVLKTGETRTDVDGHATLLFTPERVAYDRRLTLEVEVVDGAGRAVSGRGSAIMGRGMFTVTIRPGSRLVMVGRPVPVEVTTLDHTGKPVSAAVTLELDQEAWNPLERRYTRSTRPLASTVVTTDAQGRGFASLTPAPARSGSLIARARAEDARGNGITAETSVWIYDPRVWDYAYRYPTLEAFPDKPRYQPGDSARILINTEVANAAVLATVEGRDIADQRVVHLFGNTGLVTLPIRAEYAPNVFVSLNVRKGAEVHSRTLELQVAATRHDLKITLAPDRDQYRPGDAAKIAVETRDASGAPARAEVSVGVVDEAIYSLRADATPDPHDVFYGRRPNWVTTVVSFPVLYYGGVDKGGQPDVRKDFRDVAFWGATVLTDEQGKGEVSFKVPDNLTTWRITSRGATEDTRVGRAVAKTLVTKDIVARLAGPRAFVAGDQAALVSVVNNRKAVPLPEVDETLEASSRAKLSGPGAARTSLPANGEARGVWPVEIEREEPKTDVESSDAVFVFRARTKSDTDALEVRIPVRPRAVTLRSRGAGLLTAATENAAVALPAALVRRGSEVRVDLSPSPAAMLLAASEWLTEYPYGCTEQTADAILPVLYAAQLVKVGGVAPPGWTEPAQRVGPYLDRLVTLASPAGGWGWWPGDDPDPYLTALAMDAIARARAAGIEHPNAENALNAAVYNLPRTLAAVRSLDGEAYCLAHLSPLLALQNVSDRFPELKPRLEELALAVTSGREQLGVAGLGLAIQGLAALGGHEKDVAPLSALLMKRAVTDGSGLHWPADPDAADAWFGEESENSGYALAAMMKADPRDVRAAEVVRWLASRRTGRYWRSTRTTAVVAAGLADYLRARLGELKPEYRLRVEWNGEMVLEQAVKPSDVFGAKGLTVKIPGGKLKPGGNRLAISKQGAGSVYWSWDAKSLVPSPGPDTGKEKRLAITREYLHAERTADRRGRPRWLTSAPGEKESFRVGDPVLVRLTLKAPRRLGYLVIEDPRLAGFEVDQVLPEGADWPWWAHAEERDDRVAFFLDHLDEGETVLEYLIRPEIAGSFAALPTSAGLMYDPDLEVRGGAARVSVAEK